MPQVWRVYNPNKETIMAEAKEPTTIEVKDLGTVTKVRDGQFKMSNADVEKFYNDNGIPNYKDLVDRLNDVKRTLADVAVNNLLKDEVIKTKNEAVIKCGIGAGRTDITLQPTVNRRNVQTGESFTVYGNVRIKEHWPSPFRPNDKSGLFDKLTQDIEKHFK